MPVLSTVADLNLNVSDRQRQLAAACHYTGNIERAFGVRLTRRCSVEALTEAYTDANFVSGAVLLQVELIARDVCRFRLRKADEWSRHSDYNAEVWNRLLAVCRERPNEKRLGAELVGIVAQTTTQKQTSAAVREWIARTYQAELNSLATVDPILADG